MTKIDLIIFPFHDYKKWIEEGFRTRDGHLYQNFKCDSRIGKILVVNRPTSLAEIILKRRKWAIDSKNIVYKDNKSQLCKVEENVYVLDTFLPHLFRVIIERKSWWDTCFRNESIINSINKSINIVGMNVKCALLQTPMAAGIIGKLEEDIIVFDAIDNWLEHPQMNKYEELINRNYQIIKENSNLIFTVSKNLKKLFDNKENVYWIPNGVDKDKFNISIKSNYGNCNSSYIIGYIGKIQDRIDFELVEYCIRSLPEHTFKFYGPILACKDKIKYLQKSYSNIEFLGDVHYDRLPEKIKEFDVCIIPHKVNEFTNSMNPLKLYEYVASGKQVITTNIAGTEDISQYVYIEENYEGFLDGIIRSIANIKNDNSISIKIANSLDDKHIWKSKSDAMINYISNVLDR